MKKWAWLLVLDKLQERKIKIKRKCKNFPIKKINLRRLYLKLDLKFHKSADHCPL